MDLNATSSVVLHTAQRRPNSLWEVALWARERGGMDRFLREFLDEFYMKRKPSEQIAMLSDEPPLSSDARTDAYLAAVAEHLAFRNHLTPPNGLAMRRAFSNDLFSPVVWNR
ncbi:hypothetical protein B1B_10204 [mine drainage metagenome]|uniref:Uncharacterized protein n=1 Tax=mine drainage metagenome TaxID=410659 RepID=T1BHA7_9ZZZZ